MASVLFLQDTKSISIHRDISTDVIGLMKTPDVATVNEEKYEFESILTTKRSPYGYQPPNKDKKKSNVTNIGTLNDLLIGYIRNKQALDAFDECLYNLVREWDTSDFLTKTFSDCKKLLSEKCAEAHVQLLDMMIDPKDTIYQTLLRLARKIKVVNLVIGNQKMVYIPHSLDQLQSLLENLSDKQNLTTVDIFGGRNNKVLENLIFQDRTLYKDTTTRKDNQSSNGHATDKKEKKKLFNRKNKNEIELVNFMGNVIGDHTPVYKCEGCGNNIDLHLCYETAITYTVPAVSEKLFYFHDGFCVTLRRLKESIRGFVMNESLSESQRSSTTIGYVKNLLTNFSTLITTKGIIPRPSDSENKSQIEQMSMIRDNAYKLIVRQQAFSERKGKNFADEYCWKFAHIPETIQYANMSIYGPSLSQYVVQQLLSKQLNSLWLVLAFIAQGMSATNALKLLEQHRTSLTKTLKMENLDLVLISMIESSNYTIAMALYLSAWMRQNAEFDLSRADDFEAIGEKYVRIASELVNNVESDHLLSLLLEAPTDIAHLSVFEIAIKYEIDDFMDDSRIQMIMVHMSSEFDFLNPAKQFRTKDIELYQVLTFLAWKPAYFYYCPVGRFWTESVMYVAYVCIVTAVLYAKNYDLTSRLLMVENILWTFNIGFIFGELTSISFEGYSYFTDPGNTFDILIMINWVLLGILRFGCEIIPVFNTKQCNGHNNNTMAVLLYTFIFCIQICICWSRLALIFSTAKQVGPFIKMIPGMVKDILNWTFVISIFYVGFSFGTHFIIGTDVSEECESGGSLNHLSLVFEYNFLLLLGQSDWEILNPNNCVSPLRSLMLKVMMWSFSIIGTILLLNLLIAMMSSTYEQIREGTAKQVNFARAEQTYQLAHRNAIIPPPLNVLAFAFSIVWFCIEFLVWICSCGNCILNIEKLVPVFIDYDKDFTEYTNANIRKSINNKSQTKCCGIIQALKNKKIICNLFSKYNSTARYCSFCRCYMRVNGNISHYFELFISYRLDEADVKFMESLMRSAGICPQCYRPYRKYNGNDKTNRLYRWQVILEILSFYVFMFCVYCPLIILIAIPALFDGCTAFIKDITSATKIVHGGQMLIKDDKYVELVENIIDKESVAGNEVITAQMSVLNNKLIQLKINVSQQINLINILNTKMDQMVRGQTDIFEISKNNKEKLNIHTTNHNKQIDFALKHQNEMELFRKELFTLKQMRVEDDKRQNKEIKLHNEQIGVLKKQIEREKFLRQVENQKHETEQQKRQFLQLKQEQNMKILTAELQQIRAIRETEQEKKLLFLKIKKENQKKINDIENELLLLKKQGKNDINNTKIIQLENQLNILKLEATKSMRNEENLKELNELKEIEHKNKEEDIKYKIKCLQQELKNLNENEINEKRKNEKAKMEHLIKMEKLKNSIFTLSHLNIDEYDYKNDHQELFDKMSKINLKDIDENNNGYISKEEFMNYFVKINGIKQEIAQIIFVDIDANHDGKLSITEFTRWQKIKMNTPQKLNKFLKKIKKNNELI